MSNNIGNIIANAVSEALEKERVAVGITKAMKVNRNWTDKKYEKELVHNRKMVNECCVMKEMSVEEYNRQVAEGKIHEMKEEKND